MYRPELQIEPDRDRKDQDRKAQQWRAALWRLANIEMSTARLHGANTLL